MKLKLQFNPIGYFKSIKQKYMLKTPCEKWELIRVISASSLQFVGCEMMNKDYKLSVRSMIPGYLGLNYVLSMLYALYYYQSKNNPLKAMQSTPLLAIIVPVCFTVNKLINS